MATRAHTNLEESISDVEIKRIVKKPSTKTVAAKKTVSKPLKPKSEDSIADPPSAPVKRVRASSAVPDAHQTQDTAKAPRNRAKKDAKTPTVTKAASGVLETSKATKKTSKTPKNLDASLDAKVSAQKTSQATAPAPAKRTRKSTKVVRNELLDAQQSDLALDEAKTTAKSALEVSKIVTDELMDAQQSSLGMDDANGLSTFPKFYITRKQRDKRFRKANSLVHHHPQQVMTPVQQKLTNILLRHAQHNEPVGELTWEIPAAEVLKILDSRSRNYANFEKIIEQMMSIKMKWDALETKGLSKNWAVVFPRTKYLAGMVTYRIEKDVAEQLSNLDSYTSLDIDEEMALTKSCSIPIFENASRYLNLGYSRWFQWEKLRDMVLSSEKLPVNAQTWSLFNEKYLSPAVKDVNSKTRLLVQVETQRSGKFVKYVRLLVQKPTSRLNNSARNAALADRGPLIDSMNLMGIAQAAINRVLRDYTEEDIKGAIAHVKWRRSATNMRPIFRTDKYFLETLKNGWYRDSPVANGIGVSGELFPEPGQVNPMNEPSDGTPSRQMNGVEKSTTDVGMEKMIQAVKAQRIIDAKTILGELTAREIEDLYAEYNDTLMTDALRIKRGRNKAGVLAAFQYWYAVKIYGADVSAEEIVKFMARKVGSTSNPL